MTRQAGVHVGHGDSCEHAADERVSVWNEVRAVNSLLSKLNKKKFLTLQSTWIDRFLGPQNTKIDTEGKERTTLMDKGETKEKNVNHGRRNYGITEETRASFTHELRTI